MGTAARRVCLKPLSRTLNMVNLALRVFCFNETLRLVASEGCAGERRFGGQSGGQGRGAARGLSSERPGLYSQLCQGLRQVITEVSVSSSALGSKLNRSLDSGGRTRINLGFLNCVILSPRDAGPCLGTSVAVMTGVLPASSGCQALDSSRCSVICTPPPAAHLEDGMTRRTRSVIKTWGIEAESVMSTPFRGFTRQICTWKLP